MLRRLLGGVIGVIVLGGCQGSNDKPRGMLPPGSILGIERHSAISALELAAVPAPNRNALERFFRSREAQFRFCHQERGMRTDSLLTGAVEIVGRLPGVDGGRASDIRVSASEWKQGNGAVVETCLRQRVGSWAWPKTERGNFRVRIEFATRVDTARAG